jgi:hypothetical protein
MSLEGSRAQFMRTMMSLVFAWVLIAAGIARLGRVPRPTFTRVERIADEEGQTLELGQVSLVRPGQSEGRVLGWAIRCGGREIISVRGVERPQFERADRRITVVHGAFRREIRGCDATAP